MCRLLGVTAGQQPISATFWLLGAPNSLSKQSVHNPDGTGLGTYDEDGYGVQERQALEAAEDRAFAQEARERRSSTFLGHVRYSTGGQVAERNCHPFLMEGRFVAHNGVIGDLTKLEAELGDDLADVIGETDSERYAALITREIRRSQEDVAAGIIAAARWISTHLPTYSINVIVTAQHELWALRQGDTHPLLVLDRALSDGGQPELEHVGSAGTPSVRSPDAAHTPCVVVATEEMDDDPRWSAMAPGELLHVDPNLHLTRRVVLDPPVFPLSAHDLDPHVQASQHHI